MQCSINETYPCIIGESLATGLPAYLVRFTNCNLACSYCDTRYARTEEETKIQVDELAQQVIDSLLNRALLTGGEPMLQEEAVNKLMLLLNRAGVETWLETNGTIPLASVPKFVHKVVDVKTPGAGHAPTFHMGNLECLFPADQLKFVLTGRADYEWTLSFLKEQDIPLPPGNVLLSPAAGRLSSRRLAEWMLEDRSPFRFHLQLHKFVWGDQRGV